MQGYRFLLQKRLYREKLNLILLLLLLLITFGSLWLNNRTATANSQISLITEDIKANEAQLKRQNKELINLTGKDKLELEQVISGLKQDTQIKQQIVKALKQENWQLAYTLLANENERILRYEKEGKTANTSAEFIDATNRELLLFRYLAAHDLPYEPTDFSTKGFNFLAWVATDLIPYFFVLVLTFILTNFYLLSYRSNGMIDTDSLIPGKNITKQFVKISTSIGFTLMSFICYLFLAFSGAALLFGSGGLKYPYIVYTSQEKMHVTQLSTLLLRSLPLQLLALVALCLLFYIVALLMKNKFGALFISLLLSSGLLLGTATLEPIQKIAPFIPTTYLNSFAIATGSLAKQSENFQLSLQLGYLVVILSILIFNAAIVMLNRFDKSK